MAKLILLSILLVLAPAILFYIAGAFVHLDPLWADGDYRAGMVWVTVVWSAIIAFSWANMGGL